MKFNTIYENLMKPFNEAYENRTVELQDSLILEDVSFHRLPRKFTNKLTQIIISLKQNYLKTRQFSLEIDIREYLNLITKEQTENIQNFYQFIQKLKNCNNPKILTIQLAIQNSYQEPIALLEFSNKEYSQINHTNKSAPYSYKLSKQIEYKTYSQALKIMNTYIDTIEDLGILSINPKTITDQMWKFDNNDTIIGHQIRHFLIFLQRWAKTNYEICMQYSNNPNIDPEDIFKMYNLNQNEFITLSATHIERLINIWNKFKRNNSQQQINLLIKTILLIAKHDSTETLKDFYWFDLFKNLSESKQVSDILFKHKIGNVIKFFSDIFDDSKYEINDKFKTLMKWTFKSFNQNK